MRAVFITGAGGPEVLDLRDVETPVPPMHHVLVRVRATALNRADLLQRRGAYPAPPDAPADIPGLEFAGEVAALGPGVREWREGDRVFGIVGGGAHAEYVLSPARTLAPVPKNLEWADAAAVPEAFITAHDALVTLAALRASERVLIPAVGSGVGLAAVQLVRALGAVPYGTSRTADKIERARPLGLEDGIVLGEDLTPLRERVAAWSGGQGMHVVLDLVGGPYFAEGIESLGHKGRLILIGTMGGVQVQAPLRRILSQRLTVRGTMLRSRPIEEKILASRAFAAEVVPLLERGLVRPVVDSTFPLGEIRAAHQRMESNETFGKIVLTVD
jgi:putative PIG3 family NAD(P)H quinone oxidoreductase